MPPTRKAIDPKVQEWISTHANWGGHLNWAVFQIDEEEGPAVNLEQHARAAVVQCIAADVCSPKPGRKITASEFFGAYRTHRQAWVNLGSPDSFATSVHGYEYAFANPPYSLNTSCQYGHDSQLSSQKKFERVFAMFDRINEALLVSKDGAKRHDCDNKPPLRVFEYGTEWSSFFINEWWDFCWTIWSHEYQHLVVIWGTATD